MWIITKQTSRYSGLAKELPDLIICNGTKEQAEELAFRLSNWYPGCDYIFFVADEENPPEIKL